MHESGLSGSLLRTVIGFSVEAGRNDSPVAVVFDFVIVEHKTAAVVGAITAAGNGKTAGRTTGGCDGIVVTLEYVGITVADGKTTAALTTSCVTVGNDSTRVADVGIDWIYVCCMGLPTTLTSRPSAVRDNSCIGAVVSNPASDGCGLISWPPTSDGESDAESFSVSVRTLDISVHTIIQ